ncbi:hypothetical protein [Maricaulis parjimensis]|uniref:hypothetical protein n=1 Tax=Maricaulis parjimensis TaxID=144023 RepID=UPI00193A403B|nr:hypothetical protein [Maricaulis parjimensis]
MRHISIGVDRAEELLSELRVEFDSCLARRDVSDRALILTHEIFERCSNAMDQVMFLAWSQRVKPMLTDIEIEKAKVYFPVAKDEHSLASTLGRAKCGDLGVRDPEFYALLLEYQPYLNPKKVFQTLRDLANAKHRGLIPQTRTETREVRVSAPSGGSVSWGPGVTFGAGVSIMGVPIDPSTQLPVPNDVVRTEVVTWVSFLLEGTDLNALAVCERAVSETKALVADFRDRLALS